MPEISDQAYDQKKRELDNLQAELDPLGLFADTSQDERKNAKPDVGDDRLDAFKSPPPPATHAQSGQHLRRAGVL